jgi:hypothetical protein
MTTIRLVGITAVIIAASALPLTYDHRAAAGSARPAIVCSPPTRECSLGSAKELSPRRGERRGRGGPAATLDRQARFRVAAGA